MGVIPRFRGAFKTLGFSVMSRSCILKANILSRRADVFGTGKKINSGSHPTNQGAPERDFFDAPHHLYFAFKIAGNLTVIQTIREVCVKPNLESLSLACTDIDDEVINSIIESLIKKEGSVLKDLDLSGNRFTNDGISRLLDAIEGKKNCKLQKLSLAGNKGVTEMVLQRAEAMMQQRKSATIQCN